MKIGEFDVESNVLLIAEIGNNHEGNFELAAEMIKQAAQAGADAVKFQTFNTGDYVSCLNKERTAKLSSFELKRGQWRKLRDFAEQNNVLFFSTPFDLKSADFLNELVPAFKIASGDNTFYPLLRKVAEFGKPIILSTGMLEISQIRFSKSYIENIWAEKGIEQSLAILHCVASYPTSSEDANLLAIREIVKEFGGICGYSDHTLGIEAAAISVALGARVIEKHFTLDKNYSDFRDHQLSATPDELKLLREHIDQTVQMLGTEGKKLLEVEKGVCPTVRRSIVAKRNLSEGDIVTPDDITWVRPSGGLAPGRENEVLGRVLKQRVAAGDFLLLENLG